MSSFPLFLKDEPTRAKPILTFATDRALWSIGAMDRSNFVCVNGRVFIRQYVEDHSAATDMAVSRNYGSPTWNSSFADTENRALCRVRNSGIPGSARVYHFNARVAEEPLVHVGFDICGGGRRHR